MKQKKKTTAIILAAIIIATILPGLVLLWMMVLGVGITNNQFFGGAMLFMIGFFVLLPFFLAQI